MSVRHWLFYCLRGLSEGLEATGRAVRRSAHTPGMIHIPLPLAGPYSQEDLESSDEKSTPRIAEGERE